MNPAPSRPHPALPQMEERNWGEGVSERVGRFLLAVMEWKVGSDGSKRGSEGHCVRDCDRDLSDHPSVAVVR